MSEPADDEPVPRLPRGRGLKLDTGMIVRIIATTALLVMILAVARPCANATSKFVTDFGDDGSAAKGKTMPQPGNVDLPKAERRLEDYEHIGPNMTEAEQKAAIERARQKAAEKAGSGSAAGSAATDSGSATGSGSAIGSGSATGSGSAN